MCILLFTVHGPLFHFHSEELRHHLDTEVIPAINSVEKAKADSDLHASEVG